MTQNEKILAYMRDFGSISTMQAFTELGCTRLASRISELRKAGHNITDEFVTGKNRYGESVSYKKYSIKE